jgi:hypothetical protein
MSHGLEMCSSFATLAVVRGYVELSVPCAVTVLMSCVEFHFNNIDPFLIRPVVFAHLSSCPTQQLVTRKHSTCREGNGNSGN